MSSKSNPSLADFFAEAEQRSTTPAPKRRPLAGLLGIVASAAIAGVLLSMTITPGMVVSSQVATAAIDTFEALPEKLDIGQPMLPTNLYYTDSDTGESHKFATFYEQYRVPVEFDEVAPVLYDAILSSEDPRFYEHGGIDLIGTTRAVLSNTFSSAGTQGGSSISQQYVKNIHIQECESTATTPEALQDCWEDATSASGSEGITRKIQEMRYALTLNEEYAKNDMLLGYLNIVNFGGRTYGIEAASQRYFGVSASALTLAQATALAGMVQSPNIYRIDQPDSERNGAANEYALTKSRQTYVLDRMLADGKITQADHDAAASAPIVPNIQPMTQGCADAAGAAYFCQYVVNEVRTNPAFGETPEQRALALRRGGLDIYTTLDPALQRVGEQEMTQWVPSYKEGMDLGAAGVSVETGTGRILSMVQNTGFSEDKAAVDADPSLSSLVYAADHAHGGSIGFPVGSAYKLFTLIDWVEKGHSVYEGLNGRNRVFTGFTCDGEPVPNNDHISNFGRTSGFYATPVTFTAQSLNSGFLAMAEKLDLCDINRAAERMGVHLGNGESVTETNRPYETVLGSRSIAPLQMSTAYAAVANGGKVCEPRAIDKALRSDGSELELNAPSCAQVLTPEVSAAVATALKAVMTRTGAASNPRDGVPVLGKTGTHETYQTTMIQSSTKVTTAVWVGNASGFTNLYETYANGQQITQLRHKLSKAMQAAANAQYGGDRFPEPPRKMTEVPPVHVPDVSGMAENDAVVALSDLGFSTFRSDVSAMEPAGTVVSVDPGVGSALAPGAAVTVYVSNGKGERLLDVAGRSLTGAKTYLRDLGYTSISGGDCTSDEVVYATKPAAGTVVGAHTPIALLCR